MKEPAVGQKRQAEEDARVGGAEPEAAPPSRRAREEPDERPAEERMTFEYGYYRQLTILDYKKLARGEPLPPIRWDANNRVIQPFAIRGPKYTTESILKWCEPGGQPPPPTCTRAEAEDIVRHIEEGEAADARERRAKMRRIRLKVQLDRLDERMVAETRADLARVVAEHREARAAVKARQAPRDVDPRDVEEGVVSDEEAVDEDDGIEQWEYRMMAAHF